MVLSEISPRRARCSNWFLEYLRAHCHVLVLPDSSSWPAIQEILVVEEIHDLDPAGTVLPDARLPTDDSRDGLQGTKGSYVFLYRQHDNLHLLVRQLLSKILHEKASLISSKIINVTPSLIEMVNERKSETIRPKDEILKKKKKKTEKEKEVH